MLRVIFTLGLATSAFAGTILEENFTSPIFPPPGWSIQTTGSGGSWTRSESGQPGNGYAHGLINLTSASSGTATLITSTFYLAAGDTCEACFSFRATTLLTPPTTSGWSIILRNGTTEVSTIPLSETPGYPTWSDTCIVFPDITTSSSNYSVAFRVSGSRSSPGSSQIIYDLDNIHLATYGVSVEPASLGKIKTFFH